MSEHRRSRLQAQEFKQCISMPAEYFKDTIRAQLCSLMDENQLQDVSITLRLCGQIIVGSSQVPLISHGRANSVNLNSFLLSLVSPVFRKMVCGNFEESASKRINLDDVEHGCFLKLVRLACGKDGITAESVDELFDIGALAERLQMDAIREHAENILLKQMKEGTCVEIFQRSEANVLKRLRTGCYKILQDKFQTVSDREGFERLSEETMGNLLDEDELGAKREEDIFEALVRWIKGSEEGYRGEGLLRKIRFGVISDEYLANDMSSTLPGREMLNHLMEEALAKKRGEVVGVGWDGVERLCEKWMVPRSLNMVIGSDILLQPTYVAIDSQEHILVSDSDLHQVIVFNRHGSVVRRIGSHGEADGEFDRPAGIAVDRQGRIVVADGCNHRIQVLNADGSVARCFGIEGNALSQFSNPHGVAIDGEGHIVVSDNGNHRIQVFDGEGTVVRHFGSKGAAVGQFDFPRGVAVDGMGRIAVADSGNHRVQVFNGDGSVALCFGSKGCEAGQFQCPDGVAVEMQDRFVVTEWGKHRVQVFNSDGSVARGTDAAESGAGRLQRPCGVAVDGTGRIVVVEGYGRRVRFL